METVESPKQEFDARNGKVAGPGLRYAKLGYVALNVTDIARSRRFYETTFGLEVSEVGGEGEVYLRCSADHHNIILYPASRAGLRRIAWQMASDVELGRAFALLNDLGLSPSDVDPAECSILHQSRSIRYVDPFTGAVMEFYAEQDSSYSFTPSVAKIQRLGHVVLMTTRYDEAVRFYLDTLNFRASDAIGDRVTFMRCFPNPYHHSFGIGCGSMNGLHHINFMVSEIDDIGKGLWRFQKNDVPIVYGPGRHPPSDSVFLYVSDPDGITLEYSYGMEEFPEVGARAPRILPLAQESSDTWGGPPPRINLVLIEVNVEPYAEMPVTSVA